MNSIVFAAEPAQEMEDREEIQHYLQMFQKLSCFLFGQINDILGYSKLKAGQMDFWEHKIFRFCDSDGEETGGDG